MRPITRFNQVVRRIELLYSDRELGKVITWADETYNDRWSLAISKMDLALGRHERGELTDHELTRQIDIYEATLEPLMLEYKRKQTRASTEHFAQKIRESWGEQ